MVGPAPALSRRARPGCAPRALPWASPLRLVAGLQQAGAVPLRRCLVSRVLPGSGLRNSGGSASLQRRRERPGSGWLSERPLHKEAAALGSRSLSTRRLPWPPVGRQRSPVGTREGAGPECLGRGRSEEGGSRVLWAPLWLSAPPCPSTRLPRPSWSLPCRDQRVDPCLSPAFRIFQVLLPLLRKTRRGKERKVSPEAGVFLSLVFVPMPLSKITRVLWSLLPASRQCKIGGDYSTPFATTPFAYSADCLRQEENRFSSALTCHYPRKEAIRLQAP